MKGLKAAVVGCGKIGFSYDFGKKGEILSHAKAYEKHPRFELVAVCDVEKSRASRCGKRYGARAYTNYGKMLEKEQIDVVSICTPTKYHHEIALEAAKGNVSAIFCEKPFGYSSAKAKRVIKECRKKGIALVVNYSRRWSNKYRELVSFIEKGKVGRIEHVSFYYGKGLFNNGSHAIDLLHWLLGEVDMVSGKKVRTVFGSDADVDALLLFKSGAAAAMNSVDYRKHGLFSFDAFGPRGIISVRDYDGEFKLRKGADLKEKDFIKSKSSNCLMNALDEIASAISKGGKEFNAENAVYVLEVIEKILKSAESGCPIRF